MRAWIVEEGECMDGFKWGGWVDESIRSEGGIKSSVVVINSDLCKRVHGKISAQSGRFTYGYHWSRPPGLSPWSGARDFGWVHCVGETRIIAMRISNGIISVNQSDFPRNFYLISFHLERKFNFVEIHFNIVQGDWQERPTDIIIIMWVLIWGCDLIYGEGDKMSRWILAIRSFHHMMIQLEEDIISCPLSTPGLSTEKWP